MANELNKTTHPAFIYVFSDYKPGLKGFMRSKPEIRFAIGPSVGMNGRRSGLYVHEDDLNTLAKACRDNGELAEAEFCHDAWQARRCDTRSDSMKATYQGNCTNSFDKDTGTCLLPFFVDVSDFARANEDAWDLEAEEFWAVVEHNAAVEALCKDHKLRYFFDERTGVYMLYDRTADIHYFFVK